MEVISLCPLSADVVRWAGPEPRISFVVKALFSIAREGAAELIASPPLLSADRPSPLDANELLSASDLAPRKTRVDVVLVGHARSPSPTTVTPISIAVGPLRRDLFAVAAEPCTLFPLSSIHLRDRPHARANPVSVGPRSTHAAERRARAPVGGQASSFARDFDFGFFNVAALDQQMSALREDFVLRLEGLLPAVPLQVVRLPPRRPTVHLVDAARRRILKVAALVLDTVVIDTDEATCALVWRGESGALDEGTSLAVAYEPMGAPRAPAEATVRIEAAVRARAPAIADAAEPEGSARDPDSTTVARPSREAAEPPQRPSLDAARARDLWERYGLLTGGEAGDPPSAAEPVPVALLCPFAVGIARWPAPSSRVTVVVKATFSLARDGLAPLAPAQQPLSPDHQSPSQPEVLRYASDFVPVKARADVLLVGGVKPAGEAILRVDTMERRFPAGSDMAAGRPLSARAPRRRAHASRGRDVPAAGAPPSFFNAAPREQQLPALREGARLMLSGILPGVPRREVKLPGTQPEVHVVDRSGRRPPSEIPMRCDTLVIHLDAAACVLVWRGSFDPPEAEDWCVVVDVASRTGGAGPSLETRMERAVWTLAAGPHDAVEITPMDDLPTLEEPPRARPARQVTVVGAAPSGPVLPFTSPSAAAVPSRPRLAPEAYAAVCAELGRGRRRAVLARHGFDDASWAAEERSQAGSITPEPA